jgi:hypothetical protein
MAKIVGHAMASISADLTAVDTSQRNELGTVVQDKAGAEYIYLAGVASLAAGDWVMYNSTTATDSFLTTRMVSTPLAGFAAVAMAAVTATTSFGWFQIRGKVLVANIATGAADGSILAQGATPGRAAIGATATKNLFNAVGIGTAASNVGAAFICYPFCFNSSTI